MVNMKQIKGRQCYIIIFRAKKTILKGFATTKSGRDFEPSLTPTTDLSQHMTLKTGKLPLQIDS